MSINKVILIGNCCKDAETRYMTSGEAVTTVTAETNKQSSRPGAADLEDATSCHTEARPKPDISWYSAGRGARMGLTRNRRGPTLKSMPPNS